MVVSTLRRAGLLAMFSFSIAVAPSCGKGSGGKCDQARGDAIEAGMLAWCAGFDREQLVKAPEVGWATKVSHPPTDAILIELTPGAVSVERGDTVGPDGLANLLEGSWTKTGTWALAIAGDVPRAEVAAVLKVLADSRHPTGYVLLTQKGEVQPPDWKSSPHSAVMTEIQETVGAAPAAERSQLLRAEIQKRAPACFSLDEIATALQSAPPHQDCRMLAREVTKRLVACDCPKQSDMLAAIISPGISLSKLPRVAAPAAIDPTAVAKSGATWAEIVTGLGEADLATLWVDAG